MINYKHASKANEMPPSEDGLIPTLNGYGYMIENPLSLSQKFIDYATETKGLVLDIGTAYGSVAIPSLIGGASVIANDLDSRHLEILWNNTPEHLRHKLQLVTGKFPDVLDAKLSQLKAIHASGVLHYLSGEELKKAFRKIFDLLESGGKFFFFTSTPYITLFSNYYPIYLKKKSEGTEWPGLIENSWFYAPHHRQYIPQRINLLDQDMIIDLFIKAGFHIEKIGYQSMQDVPQDFQSAGKECIGVVAVKDVAAN